MGSPPAPGAAAAPGPPAFRDRAEAGARLGARLREVLGGNLRPDDPERFAASAPSPAIAAAPGSPPPVVLALPRGGVPVAAEVARALCAPLGILLVRKLGHPQTPELGLGAIAEDGAGGAAEPFFDEEMLSRVGLRRGDLTDVVARERAELARRTAIYAPRRRQPAGGPAADRAGPEPGAGAEEPADGFRGPGLEAATVIVVDDGLATGVTARAALRAVRARGARRVILAVPVAPREAVRAIESETGEVVTLVTSSRFRSVGEWYVDFGQLTDSDVLAVLASEARPGH